MLLVQNVTFIGREGVAGDSTCLIIYFIQVLLIIFNLFPRMTFVFTLFVTVPPTFSSQLPTTKQTKTENETVSYSSAVEAKPAATIQWILNGQNLTYTAPYNISSSVALISNSKLLKTLAYLTVNRVSWREHGNFSCLAFNNAGKKSQTTELEVRCKCSLIYTKTSNNEKIVECVWIFVLLMWLNLSFSLSSTFYSKHY